MNIINIETVYFSATFSTQKIIRSIARQLGKTVTETDITIQGFSSDIQLGKNEVLLVGMPVYAGRIPAKAVESLKKIKGDNTPAVIVCVYGNRDYDDALLELKETVEANGFRVVSAGAFIACHSIFPQVAENRPDEDDIRRVNQFGKQTALLLESISDAGCLDKITIKGNIPYKKARKIPLHPKTDKNCNQCGLCADQCPTQAISTENLSKTDKTKCIACGRCILVCRKNARHFRGLLYKFAGKKFVKANSTRKKPETFFCEMTKE